MEITDFTNKIQQNAKTHFPRNVAQMVKSHISSNCGAIELMVSGDTFNEIIEATGATPTNGHVYKFIRIADNNGNAVDIQTTKNKG